jgi:hypothetical protein
MEAWRLKWRSGGSKWRPGGFADWHHLMKSRLRIRIRIEVKNWIRIQIRTEVKSLIRFRIKVMRIRNPGVKKGKKASCKYGYVCIAWSRNNKQVRYKNGEKSGNTGLQRRLDLLIRFLLRNLKNARACRAATLLHQR